MLSSPIRPHFYPLSEAMLKGSYFLKSLLLFALAAGVIFPQPLRAQRAQDTGLPGLPLDLQHIPAQEYRQQPTNWDFVQTPDGLIYVANNDGVLQFDGSEWRLISTATHTVVRALDVDEKGTVYVGSQGDFGYLAADSTTGSLHYVSLVDQLPKRVRDFWDVWSVESTPEGVYYVTRNYLFRWDGDEMAMWESKGGFFRGYALDGDFYVQEIGSGLQVMRSDSLRLIRGGARFDYVGVYMMASAPENDILIGTEAEGFFLYNSEDQGDLQRFHTPASQYIKEHNFYSGSALPGGGYALATLEGGVIIIDARGGLQQILTRERGLPEDVVNDVFADGQGNIWLAFNNSGLARMQPRPALTLYDDRLGLGGILRDMGRYQDEVFVGTGAGLFGIRNETISVSGETQHVFVRQKEVGIPLSIHSHGNRLFISDDRGISVMENGDMRSITTSQAIDYHFPESDELTFYHSTGSGLFEVRSDGGNWVQQKIVDLRGNKLVSVFRDSLGIVWVGSSQKGLMRMELNSELGDGYSVHKFDSTDGLVGTYVEIRKLNDEIAFFTENGLYRHHSGSPSAGSPELSFYRDTVFQDDAPLLNYYERGDSIWAVYPDYVSLFIEQEDGSFSETRPEPLQWVRARHKINFLYGDYSDVLWVGTNAGLIRYDPSVPLYEPEVAPVMVREISSLRDDRQLWGGVKMMADGERRAFSFDHNDLRIDFSTPIYSGLLDTRYQYRLVGHDNRWSDWSEWSQETYTNLGPGDYTFQARARTGEAIMHPMGAYAFTILPPWYRTWWAYLAYVIGAAMLGLAAVRYRQLVEANERARQQAIVLQQERASNERLREANAKLEKVNDFKDQILSNTSHEMRTPLASIIGFATLLKDELEDLNHDHYEFLDIIEKNGHRLQETIESFVNVAKIRSGLVEMVAKEVDAAQLVREQSAPFAVEAEELGLQFRVDVPDEPVPSVLDEFYVQRILKNLLGNALKFTDKGTLRVTLNPSPSKLQLKVSDTGIGISEDFQKEMYDDFTQESSGMARSHEGSGLGLAVVKHLVAMMRGRISVESAVGEGTTFTVTLPRYVRQDSEENGVAART